MHNIRIVKTAKAPAAIGPYSQAIRYDTQVFCSGQIAIDPATGEFAGGSVAEQTRQVLENLSQVLLAASSSLHSVLKTTVYLTDMADFEEMNAAYATFFSEVRPPARATVAVAALPKGARVEIDCVAMERPS